MVAAMGLVVGASGSIAASPPNDMFRFATSLAPVSGSLLVDTADASKEFGESLHAGDGGGASVWFTWNPTTTSVVSIDTAGAGFDTLLAVYSGSEVDALSLVASNDDTAAACSSSRVCFLATAGATYRIAVDGYDGERGTTPLTWGPKTDETPCSTLPPGIEGSSAPRVGDVLGSIPGSFVQAVPATTSQWL